MKIVTIILTLLITTPLLLGFLRTWQVKNNPNQKIFLSGKIPNPKPSGLYKGLVNFKTSWEGKKFDPSTISGQMQGIGVNIISGQEKYPFKTYPGKGMQDKNLDVLKIDYNIPQNPFWLRFILDEIVEIEPNKYLGKVHIKLPGISFSLGYFNLER